MYRVKARSYAICCRPYTWQSSGVYDIEAATACMQRIRLAHSDEMIGVDVWLVPA